MPKTLELTLNRHGLFDSRIETNTLPKKPQVKAQFSLDKGQDSLPHFIASYRLKIVHEYVAHYMTENKRVNSVIVTAVLLDLLASEQWTVAEDKVTLSSRSPDKEAQLINLIKEDFLKFFNKKNTLVSYIALLEDQLLKHCNEGNSRQLVLSELPYYRFTAEEKVRYLERFSSFSLVTPGDTQNLFTLIPSDTDTGLDASVGAAGAPEFELNMSELFCCIARALYKSQMLEGEFSRQLIEPVKVSSGKILSFKVDGVLVLSQNPIEAIKRCLSSNESNAEALIAEYIDRLQRAVSASDVQTLKSYFFGLDNDIKERLWDMLFKQNQELWNKLIAFAMEHDKTFLRDWILAPNNFFLTKVLSPNYVSLCSLFVEDMMVLNVLLDTPRIQRFTIDENRLLAQNIEQKVREHFLEEKNFNTLIGWFEEHNPMSEGICRFIANYSATVYGLLLDKALSKPDLGHFTGLMQYVAHDERSRFTELVFTDTSFRGHYISWLKRAIAENNHTLFTLLTDWKFIVDAGGSLHRTPMFCAAQQDPQGYAALIELCIENNQAKMLQTLVHAPGWIIRASKTLTGYVNNLTVKLESSFREQYIKVLYKAVKTGSASLFEILIHQQPSLGHYDLKESPLQILLDTEPEHYAHLLGLCAVHQRRGAVAQLVSFIDLHLDHSNINKLCSALKSNREGLDVLINASDSSSPFLFAVPLLALEDIIDEWIALIARSVSAQEYDVLRKLCSIAGYVLEDTRVREQFIAVLLQAIADNNRGLIGALTRDIRNLSSLTKNLFAKAIPDYINLIAVCLENKNYQLLNELLVNEHTLSSGIIRLTVIDRLVEAINNRDDVLFDSLATADTPFSPLYSPVLFTLCAQEPAEYKKLIKCSSDNQWMHGLKKLTISQFPRNLFRAHSDLSEVSALEHTALNKSLLLAYGADKVRIERAMLNGEAVHLVYCSEPNNERELSSQLNELTVALTLKNPFISKGLGFILNPETNNLSAIIYAAPQYIRSLNDALKDRTINMLAALPFFLGELLSAARAAQGLKISLSPEALSNHVFIIRNKARLLNAILVSNTHSVASDVSDRWLSDFIFALGMLALKLITEDAHIGHADYLRIKESLIHSRAQGLSDSKGASLLNSLRCSSESNGLLQFVQMATRLDNCSLERIEALNEVLQKNRVDNQFKLIIDEHLLSGQLALLQSDGEEQQIITTLPVSDKIAQPDFNSAELSDYDYCAIISNPQNIAYLLSDAGTDVPAAVWEKLFAVAYHFERFDALKQFISTRNALPINVTAALAEGNYLLALLGLTQGDTPKTRVKKHLALDELTTRAEYSDFLRNLYKGDWASMPTNRAVPSDPYYVQLETLSSKISDLYHRVNATSPRPLNLAHLTKYEYIVSISEELQVASKRALEQLHYSLSNPLIAEDKKIFALDELALLGSDVCFEGRVLRIESINSTLDGATNTDLARVIAQYRLATLNEYAEKYMAVQRLNESLYPHLQRQLISLVHLEGWTVLEHEKATRSDTYSSRARLTASTEEEFWQFFNARNTVGAYVSLIIYKLLDHWNQDNGRRLVFDELPYCRFSVEERKYYQNRLESFSLIPIEHRSKLFRLVLADSESDDCSVEGEYEFTLDLPELFACIALALYSQNIIEGTPSRSLIQLGTISSDHRQILSFWTEGALVLSQNPIEAMKHCLGSSEKDSKTLIATYIRRLEQAVFDEKVPTLNQCLFKLDDDLKERLLDIVLKRNLELWRNLIAFAMEHDKNFLKTLILAPNSLFLEKLWQGLDTRYSALCSLFIEDMNVLNALLATPRIQRFTIDESRRLAKDIEQTLRKHFLEEKNFNTLIGWFEEHNPMSEGICRFIANYSATVYGLLLDKALSKPDLGSFTRLMQYVAHDERSQFSGLVLNDTVFGGRYISWLKRAIAEDNHTLFTLLTDWKFIIDAERCLHRTPMFCAAWKDPQGYAALIELCVENNQAELLQTLVYAPGWITSAGQTLTGYVNNLIVKLESSFREQYIQLLYKAAKAENASLFEILIHQRPNLGSVDLEESPLQILLDTEPEHYAHLLGLCKDSKTLIATYIGRLEQAVFDKNVPTLNQCLFKLDDDLKERLLDIVLKRNLELWRNLIAFAMEHDKNFLKTLILAPNSLFLEKLWQGLDTRYSALCSLFIEDMNVLNALLATPRIQRFTIDESRRLAKDIEQTLRKHFLEEKNFNTLIGWFEEHNPMSEGICRFIANYSATVYGLLLDKALSKPDLGSFTRLMQYVAHDERSQFSGLVLTDTVFRGRYISWLKRAIAEDNHTLFALLTDWKFIIDAEGFLHRTPMICAAHKDPQGYAALIELCIEKNQAGKLQTLVYAPGWITSAGQTLTGYVNNLTVKLEPSFREQYINVLYKAVKAENASLFEILIHQRRRLSPRVRALEESPLQILLDTEPEHYAYLLGLCAVHQHGSAVASLISVIEPHLEKKHDTKSRDIVSRLRNVLVNSTTSLSSGNEPECYRVLIARLRAQERASEPNSGSPLSRAVLVPTLFQHPARGDAPGEAAQEMQNGPERPG